MNCYFIIFNLTCDTVNTGLMVTGTNIFIESCSIAAMECVLLSILVTKVVNLTIKKVLRKQVIKMA